MKVGDRVRITSMGGLQGKIVEYTAPYFIVELDDHAGCKGCAEEIGKRIACKEASLQPA